MKSKGYMIGIMLLILLLPLSGSGQTLDVMFRDIGREPCSYTTTFPPLSSLDGLSKSICNSFKSTYESLIDMDRKIQNKRDCCELTVLLDDALQKQRKTLKDQEDLLSDLFNKITRLENEIKAMKKRGK